MTLAAAAMKWDRLRQDLLASRSQASFTSAAGCRVECGARRRSKNAASLRSSA